MHGVKAELKRLIRYWPAVFFVLTCLGCQRGAPSPTGSSSAGASVPAPRVLKLGFVTNDASDFWRIAAAGINKYEREAKVQVDLKMPSTGTAAEQIQILENLSSQGYDAIAVSPIAPKDEVPILNKVAASAKLITFDSDSPASNRKVYVGTNNYEAGKALGAEIVKHPANGGKMAVFVGSLAADNAQQRLKGIEDVVRPAHVEIVDKREDNTDRAKARSNVEDILNAHPDLNLVAGLWSYNGSAIAAAIDALGKKGKVHAAVFDEEDGTLAGIEAGIIDCTVVQKPFLFGYLSSKWMHELVTKPDTALASIPADHAIDTGVEIIDKGNVADFKQRLAAMKR